MKKIKIFMIFISIVIVLLIIPYCIFQIRIHDKYKDINLYLENSMSNIIIKDSDILINNKKFKTKFEKFKEDTYLDSNGNLTTTPTNVDVLYFTSNYNHSLVCIFDKKIEFSMLYFEEEKNYLKEALFKISKYYKSQVVSNLYYCNNNDLTYAVYCYYNSSGYADIIKVRIDIQVDNMYISLISDENNIYKDIDDILDLVKS